MTIPLECGPCLCSRALDRAGRVFEPARAQRAMSGHGCRRATKRSANRASAPEGRASIHFCVVLPDGSSGFMPLSRRGAPCSHDPRVLSRLRCPTWPLHVESMRLASQPKKLRHSERSLRSEESLFAPLVLSPNPLTFAKSPFSIFQFLFSLLCSRNSPPHSCYPVSSKQIIPGGPLVFD
jgi:hypothetical protein